jgi:hypothetical protein
VLSGQNNSGTTIDDMIYPNASPAQHNSKKKHSLTKYDDGNNTKWHFLQGFASVQHSKHGSKGVSHGVNEFIKKV